jgi:enoyl-CoA hydratase
VPGDLFQGLSTNTKIFEEPGMEYDFVQTEVVDEIGWARINRPDSLNALNSVVVDSLDHALHDLEQDLAVKVIVITGTGEKAFVAGGDIKEMTNMDTLEALVFARKGQQVINYIERMTTPVIAAVKGYALGGGFELALACDFIYASDNAKFGLPEVTLGVIPGFGGTQNLARLIGPNKAKELIFSGKILSAQQAREWGIVNAVFPTEDLLDKVIEIARMIARNGMTAVACAKDVIINGLNMPKDGGLLYESSRFAALFSTEDQKEGMQAFIAKRKAEFKGK